MAVAVGYPSASIAGSQGPGGGTPSLPPLPPAHSTSLCSRQMRHRRTGMSIAESACPARNVDMCLRLERLDRLRTVVGPVQVWRRAPSRTRRLHSEGGRRRWSPSFGQVGQRAPPLCSGRRAHRLRGSHSSDALCPGQARVSATDGALAVGLEALLGVNHYLTSDGSHCLSGA